MEIKQNTSANIHFYLIDDNGIGVENLTTTDVVIYYKKANETTLTQLTTDLYEIGKGLYYITISNTLTDVIGTLHIYIEPATAGTFLPVAREDEIVPLTREELKYMFKSDLDVILKRIK